MDFSARDSVLLAIDCFLKSESKDPETIVGQLVAHGIKQGVARLLVALVPVAFFRLRFSDCPDMFEDIYSIFDVESGGLQSGLLLSQEPLFQEAIREATLWCHNRVAPDQYMAVAGWSPECHGMVDMVNRGVPPQEVRFTPLVIFK